MDKITKGRKGNWNVAAAKKQHVLEINKLRRRAS